MLVTQQPVLKKFWYAIAPLTELGGGPRGFTLLGEQIVVWLDRDGRPAALRDRCCHRTAKLSKGFVEADHIVCGYHGWTYDRSGACVRIPQNEDGRVPAGIGVRSCFCRERYGWVWVALEEPLIDIPTIPEAALPGVRAIPQFFERWRTSSLRFLENAFDNSHFSYVHRTTFGDVANPQPARYEIDETPWGFESRTVVDVVNPPSSHKLTGTTEPRTTRYLANTYYVPFCRRFGCRYPNGRIHTIFNCATPVDDEHIMLAQWLYRNDTEADVTAAELNAFDRQVTIEDKEILESTDPDACLDIDRKAERHMLSDRPGIVIRKLLLAVLRAHGEEEVFRQMPSTSTMLDRA